MVTFSLFLPEAQGDISLIFMVRIWSSSCGGFHNIVGPFCDWLPLEFLTLRLVHTEPLVINQLQFWFSSPGTGSHSSFCFCLCSRKMWLPVFACLSLQFGECFALCPHLSLIQEDLLVVQFVQVFICFQDGVATSKLITCGTGNQKCTQILFFFKILMFCLSQTFCVNFES